MCKTHHMLACVLAILYGIAANNTVQAQSKAGIDISLWNRISTQPDDSTSITSLNLGLHSAMDRLKGTSINLLGSDIRRLAKGMQAAGVWTTAGHMAGLQLSGMANINSLGLKGASIAGLVTINGAIMQGVNMAGLATVTGNVHRGLSVSGLLNMAGEQVHGLQAAGMANIASGHFSGWQASALVNIAGSSVRGAQTSAVMNISGEDTEGIQLSALANISAGCIKGVQAGLLNIAGKAQGLQIGVVNYYQDTLQGIQLGVINMNPRTEVSWMLYGGNDTKLNVAAKFKNGLLYTMLGIGMPYLDFDDRLAAAVFYRAGVEYALCKRLYVAADAGFRHIETFDNRHHGLPARLYSLQGRVTLSCMLTEQLGLFASGGYGWDRHYNHNSTFRKGAIIEGGISLRMKHRKRAERR